MDYTALAHTATDLLGDFGTVVKITRNGTSVGSGNAVFSTSSLEDDASTNSSYLAQTSMRYRKVILSGLMKEPMVGDTLTADRDSWVIQSVKKVRPATTTVIYKLEIV
jgi:hypothetical protein